MRQNDQEKLSVYFKDIFVNVNIADRVYFVNGRGVPPYKCSTSV